MMATKRKNGFPVPEHFKQVDNALAGFWKPTIEGQGIQGVVGHRVESKGPDGKPNEFYTLRITVAESGPIVAVGDKPIETEVGLLVGVGSRTVQAFLTSHEGQEVVLVYRGLGRPKPGRNAPKLFETYETTEAGE
jgi:hypothetical protein